MIPGSITYGWAPRAYRLRGRLVVYGQIARRFDLERTAEERQLGGVDVAGYVYDPAAKRVALLACVYPPTSQAGAWYQGGAPSEDELNFLILRMARFFAQPSGHDWLTVISADDCLNPPPVPPAL